MYELGLEITEWPYLTFGIQVSGFYLTLDIGYYSIDIGWFPMDLDVELDNAL